MNDESIPPIPPPTPYSCPHCGFGMDALQEFCPQCGTKLSALRDSRSCLTILGIIALALLAIPSALMGACYLLFGAGELGREPQLLVIALSGFGFAGLCIWGIIGLIKK